jgi:hypothetical protein
MLRVLGGVCSANPTEARREIGYVLHHMLAVLSLSSSSRNSADTVA